jgi:hypothetical protein
LNELEEAPWGGWNAGGGIKPAQVAKLLRPFEITPLSIRDGAKTAKGYERDWFGDAWSRYLPGGGEVSYAAVTPSQPAPPKEIGHFPIRHTAADVTDVETPANPHHSSDVTDVTDRDPHLGHPGYRDHLNRAHDRQHLTHAERQQQPRLHWIVVRAGPRAPEHETLRNLLALTEKGSLA